MKAKEPGPLIEHVMRMLGDGPRSASKKLLRIGRVAVDGTVVRKSETPLKQGQRIEILPASEAHVPVSRKAARLFTVLYEDSDVIAVDKPPGLLTIGTKTERRLTLFRMVSDYIKESEGGSARLFIVHRLDRDVSGAIIFAKNADAKRKLQSRWPEATKLYIAVVESAPRDTEGTLRGFIRESGPGMVRHCDPHAPGAELAETSYRTLRRGKGWSVLEVEITTGKRHQIRVQLAGAGCPVIGDRTYGSEQRLKGRGIALHCLLLEVPHPAKGKRLRIKTQMPERLSYYLGSRR
jgi:23S rRNA pseudouridine1911/1915/1917 synthase